MAAGTVTLQTLTQSGATTKGEPISSLWTRENITWLAGLLEGEGTFHLKRGNVLNVCLGMTDEDVVRKAARIAGTGSVNGPYCGKNANHKPVWVWKLSYGPYCYALCAAIFPFMGERRSARIVELMNGYLLRSRGAPPHGTRNKYQAGCRCERCVAASRAWMKDYYWSGYREKKNSKKRDLRQQARNKKWQQAQLLSEH